ncbi:MULTISPECIES: VirK/YbjX family protein [unclassified Vibrio]|nr:MULTISPECIES: DUF535 family protein [unclassified Vibrio]
MPPLLLILAAFLRFINASSADKNYRRLRCLSSSYAVSVLIKFGYLCVTPLYLAEIPIGDDRYPLTLSFDGKIRKEGELALSLENASGDAYYTLGFTFQNNKILIGCIQGTTNDNGFSRLFTKAVFGLRPKSFMVEALQIIAQHLAIEHIYAIKNSAHIYNAKRYNKKINLNYDQLWQEHDGTEHDQWFYALPIESKRKAMEEIKRPKRKMYRERYLWLDQFKDEMIHSLQPCLLCS